MFTSNFLRKDKIFKVIREAREKRRQFMERLKQEIGKDFYTIKRDTKKLENRFRANYSQQWNDEKLCDLYVLYKDLINEMEGSLNNIEEEMSERNITSQILPVIHKKVVRDNEADWFFIEEMDSEDWKAFDIASSKEYVKGRK